jgi:hypothetical protein
MENQELHAQKVTILSRLIKESSLTLEEALLLLKEEDAIEEDVVQEPKYVPQTGTSTWRTTPYTVTYPTYLSGTTMPLTGSITGSNVTFTNTIADSSADLNN